MKKLLTALGLLLLTVSANAQTINNLTPGSAVSSTDIFPAYQGSNPATGVTAAQINTFIQQYTFPYGNTITVLGDSIFGNGTGNAALFTPANPITITGTTHGTTCVDAVSSLTGIQVGASIGAATNMPSNDYITAIGVCNGANSLTLNAIASGSAAGQTLYVSGNIPAALGQSGFPIGLEENSILGWLIAFTGNAFNYQPLSSYLGNYQGVIRINVLNGGTGFSAASPPTFSISAPAAGEQPGTFSCSVNVSGSLTSCTTPSPAGSGTASPTFTQTAGTVGSGHSLAVVTSGSGLFTVNGDQTANILARVPDVCAAHPNIAILNGGLNDIYNGVSAATIISNLQASVRALNACGVSVALFKSMPRGTWSGGTSNAAISDLLRLRVNRAIELIGRTAYINQVGKPSVVVVDADRYVLDATNSANPGIAPIANYMTTSDSGLHPAMPAAFFAALALEQALLPWISPNTPAFFGQNDIYDATNFPGGNLLGTKGLFLGTGGSTTTGCTATAIATGWSFTKITGTATPTCALTIENPRTDAVTGQRQVITFTSATSGAATEQYQLRMSTSNTNVSAGDQIYFTCEVELSNYVQVNNIGIQLGENNGTGEIVQNAYHLTGTSQAGGYLPASTKMATLTTLNGLLPGFGTIANGGFKLYLSTQNTPITVQPTDTGYSPGIQIGYDASSGTAQFTLKVSNCAVRKLAA